MAMLQLSNVIRRFATQAHAVGGPIRYLVNVPRNFIPEVPITDSQAGEECSFANCSSQWSLDVFEVTVRGLMLAKGSLLPGDRWTGSISSDSVFLISARRNRSAAHGVSEHEESYNLVVKQSSLLDRYHKLFLLWMPAVSVSVSYSSAFHSSRKSLDSSAGKASQAVFQIHALDAPSSETDTDGPR